MKYFLVHFTSIMFLLLYEMAITENTHICTKYRYVHEMSKKGMYDIGICSVDMKVNKSREEDEKEDTWNSIITLETFLVFYF